MNTNMMAAHMSELQVTHAPLTILPPSNLVISAQSTTSQTSEFHFHMVAYDRHLICLM